MECTDLYINGRWVPGAGGARFDVINPADERVLASVASAEIADAGQSQFSPIYPDSLPLFEKIERIAKSI
ncbi:MAG: hypothetical protein ABGW82_13800, partial [Paracoccus sp. (in: a-proteobacteria)]